MTLHFGDGSSISTFASLPAIDGSALTGISGRVADCASSVTTGESNSRYATNVISVSVTPPTSSHKVAILCQAEIKNQSNGWITYVSLSTSNGTDMGVQYTSTPEGDTNQNATYKKRNFWEYDYASNTSTRTYNLRIEPNNSHTSTKAYWKNCALVAICFLPD